MGELILLAIAAAFWPILLAVVLVSLRAPKPAVLMGSFLVAGLLTTVTEGLLIIYALRNTQLVNRDRSSFAPSLQIAAGVLALVGSFLLRRRRLRGEPQDAAPKQKGPSRTERLLGKGAALAFLAGILLNLIPGVVPFVALDKIADEQLTFAATFGAVAVFYVIMFAFIEIPLGGYLVAPEATASLTARFNAWFDANWRRIAELALVVAGIYLLVEGIVRAAS